MGFFASEREKRTLYRGDLLNLAGFQGDLRMVRWLMEEGECHSVVTMAITALGGNLAVLEYLKSQAAPRTSGPGPERHAAGTFTS